MAGRAAFGGDDDKAVPIDDIGHRRGARMAAFRVNCGQEYEGRVGKIAPTLSLLDRNSSIVFWLKVLYWLMFISYRCHARMDPSR
jgi:hypothetical protein